METGLSKQANFVLSNEFSHFTSIARDSPSLYVPVTYMEKTFYLLFILLIFTACGDDGLVEPHGETTLPPPDTTGFLAIDFPTDTGSAWTYIDTDTNQEFTVRIEGTRDISGTTHRQMTVGRISPVAEDALDREALDHLTANAFYFRVPAETDFFDDFAFPISATYFYKTPQALIESAFDAYIFPWSNPTYHQKHATPRRVWDFPLKVGKEWTVFEKTVGNPVAVTRYVVDRDVRITVPAGSYQTYLVQEEAVFGDSSDALTRFISPPAAYWIAPDVGIVQYRYSRYRATDALVTKSFVLKSVHLPGPNTGAAAP